MIEVFLDARLGIERQYYLDVKDKQLILLTHNPEIDAYTHIQLRYLFTVVHPDWIEIWANAISQALDHVFELEW